MNNEDYQACVTLLKNKIFLGNYVERHRVDQIDDFRDIINLHDTEEELKNNIDILLRTVRNSGTSVWVAISDSSRKGAYALYVQLDGVAFGHYWFQIKHVRLTGRELFCVVSVLRSVPAQLVNPSFSYSLGFESAVRALRSVGSKRNPDVPTDVSTDRNEETNAAREETNPTGREDNNSSRESNRGSRGSRGSPESRERRGSDLFGNTTPLSFLKNFRGITFDHIKASFSDEESRAGLLKTLFVCFFFFFIGAMNLMYESLVILTNIVAVTGDVVVRGIHAISRLIESLSPILLAVLNCVGKLVTGLYILIAMVCGCTPYIPTERRAPPPRRQALMYK